VDSLPAPISDLIHTLGAAGVGVGLFKVLDRLFRYRQNDFPVCQTRIAREAQGMPWNKQIAVHTLPNGKIHIKALAPDP
jgi:hypothetical protein